ncbi:hypothetical protein DFJ73DRAFT_864572 [Zopfochytrium polystomum]|nr:hypothetical protein DFJ73DRAFT_864572 [Zopfochytrium polystomum]
MPYNREVRSDEYHNVDLASATGAESTASRGAVGHKTAFVHRLPPQPLPDGVLALDLATIIKTYRFPHPDVLAALDGGLNDENYDSDSPRADSLSGTDSERDSVVESDASSIDDDVLREIDAHYRAVMNISRGMWREASPSVASTEGKQLSEDHDDTSVNLFKSHLDRTYSETSLVSAPIPLLSDSLQCSLMNQIIPRSIDSNEDVTSVVYDVESESELDHDSILLERELDGDFDDVPEQHHDNWTLTNIPQDFDLTDDEDEPFPTLKQSQAETSKTTPVQISDKRLHVSHNAKSHTREPLNRQHRSSITPAGTSLHANLSASSPVVRARFTALFHTHLPNESKKKVFGQKDAASALQFGLYAWEISQDVATATLAAFHAATMFWSEDVSLPCTSGTEILSSLGMYIFAHALFEGAGCKQDPKAGVEVLENVVGSTAQGPLDTPAMTDAVSWPSEFVQFSRGRTETTANGNLNLSSAATISPPSPQRQASISKPRRSSRLLPFSAVAPLPDMHPPIAAYPLTNAAWAEVNNFFSVDSSKSIGISRPERQVDWPSSDALDVRNRALHAKVLRLVTRRLAECYEIGRGVAKSSETSDFYLRVSTALLTDHTEASPVMGLGSSMSGVVAGLSQAVAAKLSAKLQSLRVRKAGSMTYNYAEAANPDDSIKSTVRAPLSMQGGRPRRATLESRSEYPIMESRLTPASASQDNTLTYQPRSLHRPSAVLSPKAHNSSDSQQIPLFIATQSAGPATAAVPYPYLSPPSLSSSILRTGQAGTTTHDDPWVAAVSGDTGTGGSYGSGGTGFGFWNYGRRPAFSLLKGRTTMPSS